MAKLFIGKMIFSVLIPEFELRRFCFTEEFLEYVEFIKVFDESRTLIIIAFVHRAVFTMLPKIQSVVAMRAPEFSFVNETTMKVK